MSYTIDPIEESHLRTAHATLMEIRKFLLNGHPVHPGALLFDDDDPIETHVEDSADYLRDIINRIETSKFQGSGS